MVPHFPLGYTQVADTRYFAPTIILLIVPFVTAKSKIPNINHLISLFRKYILVASFSFAILFNGVFLFARLGIPVKSVPKYAHYDKKHLNFYNQIKVWSDQETIVFVYDREQDMKYRFLARLANCFFVDISSTHFMDWKTTKPIKIVAIIDETTPEDRIRFLNSLSHKHVLKSEDSKEIIIIADYLVNK